MSRIAWPDQPNLCEHRGPMGSCVDCNDASRREVVHGRTLLERSCVTGALPACPVMLDVCRIARRLDNDEADEDARDALAGW